MPMPLETSPEPRQVSVCEFGGGGFSALERISSPWQQISPVAPPA
jgi:hypothetical protein